MNLEEQALVKCPNFWPHPFEIRPIRREDSLIEINLMTKLDEEDPFQTLKYLHIVLNATSLAVQGSNPFGSLIQ
jgi:hypothetical protein